MKILCIGDVVGEVGLEHLEKNLPRLKRELGVDVTMVNGENVHNGNGISPPLAEAIFAAGADVITTGNHVFRRRDVYTYLDESPFILRPYNYGAVVPGQGVCYLDLGARSLCVINMLGTVYMDALANPFLAMEEILKEVKTPFILLDFHAEATSEKVAMAYFLDGRVSAVVGTHTHVQTADERILPGQTAFITDLGMTGPVHSSLGVQLDEVIERFKTHLPIGFKVAAAPCQLSGALIELSDQTGRALHISRINYQ